MVQKYVFIFIRQLEQIVEKIATSVQQKVRKKCKLLRDKYKKCPQQVFDTSCEQLK